MFYNIIQNLKNENVAGEEKTSFMFPFNFDLLPSLLFDNDEDKIMKFEMKSDSIKNGLNIFSPVKGKVTLYKVENQEITKDFIDNFGVLPYAKDLLLGPSKFDHKDTLMIVSPDGRAAAFSGVLGVDKAKNKGNFEEGETIAQIQLNDPSEFSFALLKKLPDGTFKSLKKSEIDFTFRDSTTGKKTISDTATGFGMGAIFTLGIVAYFATKKK